MKLRKIIFFISCFLFNILLCQNKNIPILAFHGVPPGEFSTKEQFQKMKEVGINISYTDFSNKEDILKALDASLAANTKLMFNIENVQTDTEEIVRLVKDHPALYGYGLVDEPGPHQFTHLKELILKIRKIDKSHKIYVNLFPNYVSTSLIDGLSYKDYLAKYLKEVPVDFLSFDYYPIVNNQVRESWYSNLEDVRNITLKNGMDFWAFACSTIHYNYLQPTVEGIRLQQFGNLLYGAKALQYFTYWTLTYADVWIKEKYGYSIVDDRGLPTPTYNVVKTVNEEIQRLAWFFSGAKSEQVFHTGNNIPEGTVKLSSIPKQFSIFSTEGKDALISYMSNENKNFVIVQNKSLYENIQLTYKPKQSLKKVNNDSGKESISLLSSKKYNDIILPGDILIFVEEK
ncbi:alpha-amylase family protein [Chryseobacterium sp. CT-SW4]|uniref:hypothetical protein n=1 Tax=Chryseobacterium sp. SW-1 TaxID=3157343 RepID=UPI003B017EB3